MVHSIDGRLPPILIGVLQDSVVVECGHDDILFQACRQGELVAPVDVIIHFLRYSTEHRELEPRAC